MQEGSAARRAIKPRPDMLGIGVIWNWQGIIFGDFALVLRQNIYSEAFSGVKVSVGSRLVVHANENQRWIERYRAERIRRHSMDLSIGLNTDYRDSGTETAQGPAKVLLINHVWEQSTF